MMSSNYKSEVILLVADDDQMRKLCSDALIQNGYTVFDAPDGLEALLLTTEHTDIDLLLTDVAMPGMSGPELAQAIRISQPDILVLYMPGSEPETVTPRLREREAFIPKPFEPEELVSKVRQLLDSYRKGNVFGSGGWA